MGRCVARTLTRLACRARWPLDGTEDERQGFGTEWQGDGVSGGGAGEGFETKCRV
ncbi:hypothetical protein CCMA1212_008044 [Trichoderma ghanense]|uniref:Uncharacterized protein n=1 Tax=Trichoderma ghanense TaxID=65468 RepID=A0ABY2GVN1_9HYPO